MEDLQGLNPGQLLSTSLVDYVLQTSLIGSFPQQLAIIRTFLSWTSQSSNISESANDMFEHDRNGIWLEAIDGILKKCPFVQTLREKYEGTTIVVETVYAQVVDRWEKCVRCRVVESGGDGQKNSVHQIIEGNAGSKESFALNWVDGVYECGGWWVADAWGTMCPWDGILQMAKSLDVGKGS
ncbi:hypothetical protein IV203_013630 [Nitzschia inconspicua]|uniref:Uncharacterized protein n=1 Tax=Nitzschia inconspicua TaxID=303405 RepID=A0A9K3M755_9STRA|nr:hypothetical protein IV203_013630 [Nitzschia inconspicua]